MASFASAAQILAGSVNLAESGIREMLATVPCSPEVLADTPERVVRAFRQMTWGYGVDAAAVLGRRFPVDAGDLVILKDIEFTSLCEHHLMPFAGCAHVGYLPSGFVVGLSKLARVVDLYAARLQMQERLAADIAGAIAEHVSALGVAVVIEASHGCLCHRGARKARATFVTSVMLGRFRDSGALRTEFFDAIHLTHTRI